MRPASNISPEEQDIHRVRATALRSFSPALLQRCQPQYDPRLGGLRPALHLQLRGVRLRLNWGELLWAEPGRQDYLEARTAEGKAVQFTPDSPDNDQRLLELIDSYARQRSWWRRLWE